MIAKEIKFLLVHSSIYGLGKVIGQVVSFILLPLYTRYLTPADYGTLETIDVSSGVIGIIVTIGIARALSRFYYESDKEQERNKVVSTTYLTYFALALFALPFVLFLSGPLSHILLGSDIYQSYFQIGLFTMLIGATCDIGMIYLRLIKKPLVFISITLTRMILSIVLNIFFIVYLNKGVLGILYSSLIVGVLFATGTTVVILKRTRLGFSANLSMQLLRYGLPVIPSNLGNTIVKQSDKYFVLYLTSVADMGIYSLALKMGNAVHNLLTIPFNMAYIPRRFEIMKRENAQETLSRIFTYYFFLAGYVGLMLSVLIPEVLHIMVTPKFLKAGEIVPLVVLSMVIFGTHYHFDFGILYSKKTKYLSYIGLSCAAVQIGLNYLLIRRYGFFGAVWSSTISLVLQASLLYIVSQKLYPIKYEFRRILFFALTAFIFYGISTEVRTGVMLFNIGIKLMLLLLFPATLVLLKIVTPSETAKIKEIYINKIKPIIWHRVTVKTT